jgi:tetratricopeptide (TPR) repeat protein
MVQAQRSEVRRAERQLNRGDLGAALEHINAAVQDESTMGEVGTWLTRAQILVQIATSEEPEHQALNESLNVLDEAQLSLDKAQSLEPDNLELIQVQQLLLILSELTFNEGVEAFNENNYSRASEYFLRSYEISEPLGSVDTTTLYNAALAAELNRDFLDAKTMYLRLVEYDYDQPYVYASLGNILMAEGDTTQALGYVRQGRELYPEDLNLVFSEANIYIFTGAMEEARDILNYAIEKDPENPSLYFALAANFDRMSQDTTYSHEERLQYFEEAEAYYNSALEKNPEYFDAIYNLGALYFNEGIRVYEEADERLRRTQDFARYEQDEKEFREIWMKAQPYFEQSKSMIDETHPYYENVIMSLVQVYIRTNQSEKLKEIEDIYLKYFGEEEIE